jgi:serine protease SohB
MTHPWMHYFIFLAETFTLVIAILILVAGLVAVLSKSKNAPGTLSVQKLNEKLEETAAELEAIVLDKKARKALKKAKKLAAKKDTETKKNIFVLNFEGDLQASQVKSLREEITAVLQIAKPEDEVVIKLESPGGMVSGYGLAASQLVRFKEQHIPLTVCIDKVAASGGYLMAAVADEIIAAPFAVIGSIGVVAQMPNFHRFLKKHNIDFEQVTAGKYKRTLTLFGENTEEGREKMKEDLEEIHTAFKNYVATYRPAVNIDEVATGDYWLAVDAQKLKLVDRLMTSDDYLMLASKHANIFEIQFMTKKSLLQKLQGSAMQIFKAF